MNVFITFLRQYIGILLLHQMFNHSHRYTYIYKKKLKLKT